MSNYSLELSFIDDKKSSHRHPALARIYVRRASGTEGDSRSYISLDCYSLLELRSEIKRLKMELDRIEDSATKKFAAERQTV